MHRACFWALAFGIATFGCAPLNTEAPAYDYECGSSPEVAFETAGGTAKCGEGDPLLPPEPQFPTDVCETLVSDKSFPDEDKLDTARVQEALNRCKGRAVKLVAQGDNNAFLTGHLTIDSVILWVDKGVTLYASRNAELFQKTGSCGVKGINDSSACQDYITVQGTSPGIVGDGTIDGQGGEPLVGQDYSWWELSQALRKVDGSIGNPTLINLASGTTGFLAYRITLHNSAKFHMKVTSNPADGSCDAPGEGYIVWGVTILTPSKLYNSRGQYIYPHAARNTDGIDPGTTSYAQCGVIACNTVSTSDDQIAIKGGHLVKDLIIAHNHFGTGHGMSIGSETYGADLNQRGVQNVLVYDLTIDADSRGVGHDATEADFNGIRIKSDVSRGGLVDNIVYRDICMRDMNNAILVSTAYNPLFAGAIYPEFRNITLQNVRHVSCMNTKQPVVTLEGNSATRRTGPITLDNVIIDNVSPLAVHGEYVDINLGPGDVNFRPTGFDVKINDNISGGSTPRRCVFPTLPAPELPKGWLGNNEPPPKSSRLSD
ncbi:MAG: glycoside hydrolase family 28 protein [Myxococcota bacterium]